MRFWSPPPKPAPLAASPVVIAKTWKACLPPLSHPICKLSAEHLGFTFHICREQISHFSQHSLLSPVGKSSGVPRWLFWLSHKYWDSSELRALEIGVWSMNLCPSAKSWLSTAQWSSWPGLFSAYTSYCSRASQRPSLPWKISPSFCLYTIAPLTSSAVDTRSGLCVQVLLLSGFSRPLKCERKQRLPVLSKTVQGSMRGMRWSLKKSLSGTIETRAIITWHEHFSYF